VWDNSYIVFHIFNPTGIALTAFLLIKATDQSFLHKCHRLHESNRLYGKPRLLKTTFTIRHYAGEVEYDVS
jgi:myosin heavy subunit